jgi:hypothetical protein
LIPTLHVEYVGEVNVIFATHVQYDLKNIDDWLVHVKLYHVIGTNGLYDDENDHVKLDNKFRFTTHVFVIYHPF